MPVLLAFALLIAASAQAQSTAPLCDSEASFGRADKTVFGQYCGVCHTLSGNWNRIVKEPLAGLFTKKQLVTGESVSEESVGKLIAQGGPALMPGFRFSLTPTQIDELVQYLKAARCSPSEIKKPAGKENRSGGTD
jgi:mono/diheme cytochrome c family protein